MRPGDQQQVMNGVSWIYILECSCNVMVETGHSSELNALCWYRISIGCQLARGRWRSRAKERSSQGLCRQFWTGDRPRNGTCCESGGFTTDRDAGCGPLRGLPPSSGTNAGDPFFITWSFWSAPGSPGCEPSNHMSSNSRLILLCDAALIGEEQVF